MDRPPPAPSAGPLLVAALSGAAAVAAGAFGAHGAADEQARAWLQTGAAYQLVHVAAALAILRIPRAGPAVWLLLLGGAVFAGALYGLALGGPRLLGAVAPVGGLLLIAGWLVLAAAGLRKPPPA